MHYTRRDLIKTLAALPLIRLERSVPELILYNGLLTTNGLSGSAIVHNMEELATLEFGNVTNSQTSAAFQLALWKLAYESNLSTNPTLASGTFTAVPGTAADIALANTWVAAALGAKGPVTEQLNFYLDTSMGPSGDHYSQQLVTFTPVPLPAAGWMLLSGLGGLFGIARRRR